LKIKCPRLAKNAFATQHLWHTVTLYSIHLIYTITLSVKIDAFHSSFLQNR
jgi:hypothetical protein